MRQLLLVRPEPGLSASADRAKQAGLDVIACPLFRIEPLEWEAPDPQGYDGLLLTSANAVRYGGRKLDGLKSLPAHAVGAATADAARAAGLKVATVGEDDLSDLLARLPVDIRLLHLAGDNHREAETGHRIHLPVRSDRTARLAANR
jgi:uroporphyrinogen-III synthase